MDILSYFSSQKQVYLPGTFSQVGFWKSHQYPPIPHGPRDPTGQSQRSMFYQTNHIHLLLGSFEEDLGAHFVVREYFVDTFWYNGVNTGMWDRKKFLVLCGIIGWSELTKFLIHFIKNKIRRLPLSWFNDFTCVNFYMLKILYGLIYHSMPTILKIKNKLYVRR